MTDHTPPLLRMDQVTITALTDMGRPHEALAHLRRSMMKRIDAAFDTLRAIPYVYRGAEQIIEPRMAAEFIAYTMDRLQQIALQRLKGIE